MVNNLCEMGNLKFLIVGLLVNEIGERRKLKESLNKSTDETQMTHLASHKTCIRLFDNHCVLFFDANKISLLACMTNVFKPTNELHLIILRYSILYVCLSVYSYRSITLKE